MKDTSPHQVRSPLDFNHIPHKDGLFVHFDANSRTYLVQAFFKADSLAEYRSQLTAEEEDEFGIHLDAKTFDDARDAFLTKLIRRHAKSS